MTDFQKFKVRQLLEKIKFFVFTWCEQHEVDFDVESISSESFIDDWHSSFSSDLNAKKVKYAKPVSRIIGKNADVYIACEYRDMGALKDSMNFKLFDDIKVYHFYNLIEDIEKKAEVWNMINSINSDIFQFYSMERKPAPSRQELQENIQKHKHQKLPMAQPSMHKAVQMSFIAIAEELELDDLKTTFENFTDEELARVCSELASSNLNKIMENVETKSEELKQLRVFRISDDDWSAISRSILTNNAVKSQLLQVVSFCSVQNNIPSAMMGKIENIAQQLAHDLSSGKTSFDKLDLTKIGEDVLNDCDPADMNELANNISSLLPTLTNLKASME